MKLDRDRLRGRGKKEDGRLKGGRSELNDVRVVGARLGD